MFPIEYIDNLTTARNNISHSSSFRYAFHRHINLHHVITRCEVQHVVFSANLNVGERKVLKPLGRLERMQYFLCERSRYQQYIVYTGVMKIIGWGRAWWPSSTLASRKQQANSHRWSNTYTCVKMWRFSPLHHAD